MSFLGLGTPELIIILFVALLFFGKDKLPELAKSIGKSVKELKAGFEKSTEEGMAAKTDKTALKSDEIKQKKS